jgi:Family of unknown function (DUF6152)
MRIKLLMSLVLLVAFAAPAFSHHAFAAEFDRDKQFTVTGTVSKVEWMNPHIWIYVDVKDNGGKVTTWAFQGGPPSYLSRVGWKRDDLKIGQVVTMEGFKAKDGSNHASGGRVTLPDGRKIFAGTADDGSPRVE